MCEYVGVVECSECDIPPPNFKTRHKQLLYIDCSYTKPKSQLPDYTAPVVLANGKNTIEDFCNNIHKSIIKEFKQ